MNKSGLVFICITLFLFSSCSKKIIPAGPAPERSVEEILKAVEDHNLDWDWLAIKAGTRVESPDENVSGTSYLRMKRDSIIWMVAKKLGAEVTRNLITRDSIHILYRWEQIYERGTIRDLKRRFNINLEFVDIQQLMFGNVIIPDTTSATLSKEEGLIRLDAVDRDLFLSYWINPYDLHLQKVKISDPLKREITVLFEDYKKISKDRMVAMKRTYTLPVNANETAQMEFEIKEIEIDVPKKTIFEVPSHYEVY